MASEKRVGTRDDYRWFTTISTRWMDNDVYGHVNNVIYYSFFDTAVADFLLECGALEIARDGRALLEHASRDVTGVEEAAVAAVRFDGDDRARPRRCKVNGGDRDRAGQERRVPEGG